jgi:hypothetical protein
MLTLKNRNPNFKRKIKCCNNLKYVSQTAFYKNNPNTSQHIFVALYPIAYNPNVPVAQSPQPFMCVTTLANISKHYLPNKSKNTTHIVLLNPPVTSPPATQPNQILDYYQYI